MSIPLFAFRDVTVRFGETIVLDHVTVDVADGGAVTCLLGPSGAGKSTLLRLCNRLDVPSSGEVRFRSEPIDGLDPLELRRRVGMVFQRPTLFPGSVRDNLLVARADAGPGELAAAIERARLDRGLLDRDGDALSGGEAQRACLARTLITEPDVLLMDEPTSALDPTATKGLEALGRRLAEDGMPILWVTHDLAQADRIADERIVLVAGRLADDHQIEHYLASEEAFHHHQDGPEPMTHDDRAHDDRAHDDRAHDEERTDGPG